MRRREFIAMLAGTASTLVGLRSFADNVPSYRAAVVIGVNKAGDLPVLGAAASGARQVEQWLRQQHFDVHAHIDDAGPVQAHALFQTIQTLVNAGTLDQLVIYFAGHGFLNGTTETWLLSEAPENASEAVNLQASVFAARNSGLTNVVFISDACRSTPDSLKSSGIVGYQIFPNLSPSRPIRPDIDQFFATLPGNISSEIPVSQTTTQYQGLYTSVLLDAFKLPQQDMITNVNGHNVVTNRSLKSYLATEVPRRALAASARLNQKPDSWLESSNTTYIGEVADDAIIRPTPAKGAENPTTLRDVGELELFRTAGIGTFAQRPRLFAADVEKSPEKTEFDASWKVIHSQATEALPQSDSHSSIIRVVGDRIGFAFTAPDVGRPILRNQYELVEIHLAERHAASVLIGFADGGGTVVAALPAYRITILVDMGRVENVLYDRFDNDRPADLRTTVATSAAFGAFRIEGDRATRVQTARQLFKAIQAERGIDPTVATYYAYAFADGDLGDEVRSLRGYMFSKLSIDLFDVAMLAGKMSMGQTFPFCPILSQGWGLLGVTATKLPEAVEAAHPQRRAAVWTTFDSATVERLATSLLNGHLQ
jgi:hypothetical protein